MKKTRMIVSLLLALMMILTVGLVAACDDPNKPGPDPGPGEPGLLGDSATINSDGSIDWNYAASTNLNMSIGYSGLTTAITFRNLAGPVTLPTGTYSTGELKPAWEEMGKRLGVGFTDSYTGLDRGKEFDHWAGSNNYTDSKNGPIDVLMGTVTKINQAGLDKQLVNLADYMDYLPNFKAYLQANPIVYLSLVAATEGTNAGAIYTVPYFDGNDDIERYYMMRVDFTEHLLSGSGDYAHSASKTKAMNKTVVYNEPYMPTSGYVEVEVANNADASKVDGTQKIKKNYDAVIEAKLVDGVTSGNIVDLANAYRKQAGATYDGLTNLLRKYIDVAYDGFYGDNRENLFVGTNSAWDADEMVVLTHCVIGNAYEFNDTGKMEGIFSRQYDTPQRTADIYRFGAHMFGVRGTESRSDMLYFNSKGELVDARQEADIYEMTLRLNKMYKEGLICSELEKATTTSSKYYIQNNEGFMHYDYVQSQTAHNTDKTQFQPILNPIALWQDGAKDGTYMRFTESWRSVKPDGACLPIGIASDTDKLAAALRMIDYFYTTEGKVLMTYGPDAFINTTNGKWDTFDWNGEQHPVVSSKITSKDGEFYFNNYDGVNGSYTNYARYFIGSTLCLTEKMQSFEYQLTDDNGKAGEIKVSTAIANGLIKHPYLSIQENMWYTSLPTTIANTSREITEINDYTNLAEATSYFDVSGNKDRYNIIVQIIVADVDSNGKVTLKKTNTAASDVANNFTVNELLEKITEDWGGKRIIQLRTDAWTRQLNYYNSIVKK